MSAAILLVLPIFLSGYIFANSSLFHKYRLIRLEGYHLYFTSASYGVVITISSAALYLLLFSVLPDSIVDFVRGFRDFVVRGLSITTRSVFPLLVIGAFSLILSLVFGYLFNKSINKRVSHYHSIKNDELELLFYDAGLNRKKVQFSMENEKVYVGVLVNISPPEEERKHIRMLPIKSGYRHPTTKEVTFNTHYEDIIAFAVLTALGDSDTENEEELKDAQERIDNALIDFQILLPLADLKAAHIYSDTVRKTFEAIRKKANKKSKKKKAKE